MIKTPEKRITVQGFLWLSICLVTACSPDLRISPDPSASSVISTPPPVETTSPNTVPSTSVGFIPFPTASGTAAGRSRFISRGIHPGEFLQIKDQPGRGHSQVGEIPAGTPDILSRGDSVELEDSAWTPIQYRDQEGWVQRINLSRQFGSLPPTITRRALSVLSSLQSADFSRVAAFVHPDFCLRFAPYPHLTPDNLSFCPAQLTEFTDLNQSYQWGWFDGTGDPINLTPADYYARFIYDADYLSAPVVGLNREVSSGNAPNNIHSIYPDSVFIEYHYPEIDPQYGGLDWRSIRLVFKEINQTWYLIAVVHGEWTI